MDRIRDEVAAAQRVVVTGIGILAPGSSDAASCWEMVVAGRTATGPVTLFDASRHRSRLAAEVDLHPEAHGLTADDIERNDRYIQLALAAAAEAVRDSGLDVAHEDAERIGVSMGTAVGGIAHLERGYRATHRADDEWEVSEEDAPPWLFHAMLPSSLAAEVACRFGAGGPAAVISNGCTAGMDAAGYAYQLLQDGEADVMIAGAAEAGITPANMASFDAIRATSAQNDDPDTAARPFHRDRDGFVMGEGSAVLVLETLAHARARGARVYCELSGYANRCNAYHMTGLQADGIEMAEAIRDAMEQAEVAPDDIDYINAHGSGTRQNDVHETAAFKRALGDAAYRIPISSIKSMVGHSLGAIGAIELAICALAIRDGVVPPTANLSDPDPELDLNYTPNVARRQTINVALSTGSGFGGFQSAAILRRLPEGM